jgi:hypothetical protein
MNPHTDEKYIASAMNRADEGDEISAVVDGLHYRGEALHADNTDGSTEITLEEEAGSTVELYTNVEETSDPMGSTTYETFALAPKGGSLTEMPIEAFFSWEQGSELADKTLGELAEEGEDAEELRENLVEGVAEVERAQDELQQLESFYKEILDGELALAEFEKKMVGVTLDSGGKLQVSEF